MGLPHPVSLTRCGLPRIIPAFHRKKIKEGNDLLIKLYLSLFSVSRIILVSRKPDYSYKSITESGPVLSSEMLGKIHRLASKLVERYVPRIRQIPMNLGIK